MASLCLTSSVISCSYFFLRAGGLSPSTLSDIASSRDAKPTRQAWSPPEVPACAALRAVRTELDHDTWAARATICAGNWLHRPTNVCGAAREGARRQTGA